MEFVEKQVSSRLNHHVSSEKAANFFKPVLLPPLLQAVRLKWRGELGGPLEVSFNIVGLGTVEALWEGGEGEQVREIELSSWTARVEQEIDDTFFLFWRSASGEDVRVVTYELEMTFRCPDDKQTPKRSTHPRQRHA